MNYKESIRALFEAVITNQINESNAARKAAVRAALAKAGYQKSKSYQSVIKPEARHKPAKERGTRDYMARRTGRKVKGQLDPYGEKGKITLDGPREYVFSKAADLPYNSNAGDMARGMKSDIQDREEKEAREAEAEDRDYEETLNSIGRPSLGGAGREKAYPGER